MLWGIESERKLSGRMPEFLPHYREGLDTVYARLEPPLEPGISSMWKKNSDGGKGIKFVHHDSNENILAKVEGNERMDIYMELFIWKKWVCGSTLGC